MGLSDLLARGRAAEGMMRDGGGAGQPPVDLGAATTEPMPDQAPPAGGADVDGLISQLDAALDGMDPQMAEEARTHLNAIREITSKDAGPAMAEQPPPGGEPPMPGQEGMPEEPKITV